MRLIIALFLFLSPTLFSQDFSYYHIGDTSDITTSPSFGICLMGGATENDEGSSWFLDKADGGNVVVIRASGSDGYNDYFFNQLGANLQSVETIVFNNASASQNSFVQRRIANAEAIWIAGGDQFLYESYWKGSPIEDLLNSHVNTDQAPIGGTSAGMAILGEYYFNAENGTITSTDALSDPFDSNLTVENDFLSLPFLSNTITDTHYDNPDRKGRQTVFMAQLLTENGEMNYGIAADEYVAICIDGSGQAAVFGEHPSYEDYAYFLRLNCALEGPNAFTAGQPLNWNPAAGGALEVCKIPGVLGGTNTFDLNSWTNTNGGSWESWDVQNGSLISNPSNLEECELSIEALEDNSTIHVFPNPSSDILTIQSLSRFTSYELISSNGVTVIAGEEAETINISALDNGIYILRLVINENISKTKKIVINH